MRAEFAKQPLCGGAERAVEADDEAARRILAQRADDFAQFVERERQRFLDPDMFARAQRLARERRVRVMARGDEDELDGGIAQHVLDARADVLEAKPLGQANGWLEEYRKFLEGSFQRLDALLDELQAQDTETGAQTDQGKPQ